ncbi:hypothetical protein ACMGB6_001026 [Klebsiella oxytoca]
MPIKFNTTFKGITVEDAIATVAGIQLNSGHDTITFEVEYASSGEEDAFNSEIFSCEYDAAGGNIIEQAYAYLKTISPFKEYSD